MKKSPWTSVKNADHPLAALEGKPLDEGFVGVLIGPTHRSGARYFQLVLSDENGQTSQPFLVGLHHTGPHPGFNWIEVDGLWLTVSLPEREISLDESHLQQLFADLCRLIPPGGHIMVEYDSDIWEEARTALERGAPPVATALGELLYHAGCGIAFKDWYFAEGGMEGPRKLQGFNPFDEAHLIRRLGDMERELTGFLARNNPHGTDPLIRDAWERARDILAGMSDARKRMLLDINDPERQRRGR